MVSFYGLALKAFKHEFFIPLIVNPLLEKNNGKKETLPQYSGPDLPPQLQYTASSFVSPSENIYIY
jgi:hypothetical protein